MSTNEQNENLDKAKQFVNDTESGLKDFTKQTQDAIGNLSDKVKSYIDQKKNENEEPTKEGFFAHLKQQVSDAWEDTKDAAENAWESTKNFADDAWDKTKDAANDIQDNIKGK
ncbi:hypothetical protein [Elizabethkingia anophelis]|uniref:hypothetical protein n=1 Tax=Elizabethkingia anophelis TaxID=1117645 RepID=UPI0021A6C412|nr:hypothetical protein [Elizabethkingia anophelis]MCT4320204.1 hypothetical protein [Elizabethkingia anophelis]GJN60134.1 hypothetical protein ELAK_02840 [Elizabethkingia anophelis]HDP3254331.1 hypothetical protein [Elizabethkingia anophelis]